MREVLLRWAQNNRHDLYPSGRVKREWDGSRIKDRLQIYGPEAIYFMDQRSFYAYRQKAIYFIGPEGIDVHGPKAATLNNMHCTN